MNSEHHPDGSHVVMPDAGETLTIRRDYAPWLLGFCRWDIRRVTVTDPHAINGRTETQLDSGSWKWRGFDARLNDRVIPTTRDVTGIPMLVTEDPDMRGYAAQAIFTHEDGMRVAPGHDDDALRSMYQRFIEDTKSGVIIG